MIKGGYEQKTRKNVQTKQIYLSGRQLIIKDDGNEQKAIIFYPDRGANLGSLCLYAARSAIKTKVKS